jgi:hypothetical protein
MPRIAALLVVASLLAAAVPIAADEPTPEQEQFFKQTIRPILIARCWECHGEKKQESGLRLDSREALLQGGDSGTPLVTEKPEDSPLVKAIGYQGETQMPPDGKLPDNEIAALRTWIAAGAPFPASLAAAGPALGANATAEGIAQSRESHWAYQTIARPIPPETLQAEWCRDAADRFIAAKLQRAQLAPSPLANRRTLLRRVTFDLIGLPPTMDDAVEFESHPAPDAFERTIDRLLASPHYGERWGRHWLDVARYADTKGYVFTEERRYPFSYTYRDYVIAAFNADLPFDRFIVEQLAADQVAGDDKPALAAMGFLTVGRRFGNNTNDIIDDRIDVVSRGLLGLTVGCARCHDHKYDAVPTEDYYSLYGIFASSTEPKELPLIGPPADGEAYRVYEVELHRREAALQEYRGASIAELRDELRAKSGLYLTAVLHPETVNRRSEAKPPLLRRWQEYLAAAAKQPHSVFGPWQALSQLPGENFAERSAEAIAKLEDSATAQARSNSAVKNALQSGKPASMDEVARIYGELLSDVQAEWIKTRDTGAAALPDPQREELRQVLYAENSPFNFRDDEARRLLGRDKRDRITKLQREVEAHQVNSPAAPPRAMILEDAPQPSEPHVFLRGNPGRPGKAVPRRFLQVLQRDPQPFQRGSGRLELAQAIVRPDNPLTSRVIVNRIWQHHFGRGLVATPSDFGIRGEPPSHPELLDHMASRLLDAGWSLKALHRRILASSAYRQQSQDRPEALAVDPENRLVWKMNRRRLEFEPWRDSLLAVADRLDDQLTGRPIDLFSQPFSARRAVYGFIDRQDLPGTLRVFDFASPDVSTPQRAETTVPQQLLFAMNSPFVIQQAREAARGHGDGEAASVIRSLYERINARPPTAEETGASAQFLRDAGELRDEKSGDVLSPVEQLAQVLLLANEFVFVD